MSLPGRIVQVWLTPEGVGSLRVARLPHRFEALVTDEEHDGIWMQRIQGQDLIAQEVLVRREFVSVMVSEPALPQPERESAGFVRKPRRKG